MDVHRARAWDGEAHVPGNGRDVHFDLVLNLAKVCPEFTEHRPQGEQTAHSRRHDDIARSQQTGPAGPEVEAGRRQNEGRSRHGQESRNQLVTGDVSVQSVADAKADRCDRAEDQGANERT
ncbi:hypothetical protein ABZ848_34655 [Streptomyces sp. NPDC047081]|uniref:hypothetical protein n=1 Tax=Streptomyces sp. NPDC047081 TaxID=3154706 RepID=UPI0034021045